MPTEDHALRYFIAEKETRVDGTETVECVFAHGRQEEGDWVKPDWLVQDLANWTSLCRFVRKVIVLLCCLSDSSTNVMQVNGWFTPCDYPSIYRNSFLNPLNLLNLHFMMRRYQSNHSADSTAVCSGGGFQSVSGRAYSSQCIHLPSLSSRWKNCQRCAACHAVTAVRCLPCCDCVWG